MVSGLLLAFPSLASAAGGEGGCTAGNYENDVAKAPLSAAYGQPNANLNPKDARYRNVSEYAGVIYMDPCGKGQCKSTFHFTTPLPGPRCDDNGTCHSESVIDAQFARLATMSVEIAGIYHAHPVRGFQWNEGDRRALDDIDSQGGVMGGPFWLEKTIPPTRFHASYIKYKSNGPTWVFTNDPLIGNYQLP